MGCGNASGQKKGPPRPSETLSLCSVFWGCSKAVGFKDSGFRGPQPVTQKRGLVRGLGR